jgi:gamma-D-glutamyl-L-lysine dipeptidyl-peptidase
MISSICPNKINKRSARWLVNQEYCIFKAFIINLNKVMETSKYTRHFSKIVLFTITISLLAGCDNTDKKAMLAKNQIDSLVGRFIPDHRMEIGEINVKKGDGGSLILSGETTNPLLKIAISKTLSNHDIELSDSIIILPDTLVNKKFMGLVTLSVINIRKQPSHSAELVSQAILGTPVKILKNFDSWILIQTPDRYLGWTEASSVVPMTVAEMNLWKHSDRLITVVNTGLIYASPAESAIVGDIVAGCIVIKTGERHGYSNITLPDGRQGYLNNKEVLDFNKWKANAECTQDNIVRCAETFTGLPYLWGGSSSKAFDCSGFSQTVYYLNGIILLRDASLQALHGLSVDFKEGYGNIKPGDLLFFGTGKDGMSHVTHVAIYKGDTEYIHSSVRVKVTSLDSTRANYNGYREVSLLAVKRIIGVENDPGIVRVRSHPWY